MRKQKLILGIAAITLGTGSALATLTMEEYKLTHKPTPACEQAVEALPLRFGIDKTTAERVKHRKEAEAVCLNTSDTEQLTSNKHYFDTYAYMAY